jgi:hypothetical protein
VVGNHTAGLLSRDTLQPGQAELAATKKRPLSKKKSQEITELWIGFQIDRGRWIMWVIKRQKFRNFSFKSWIFSLRAEDVLHF